MNYQKYKDSRNAAWEILLDHNIKSLPVPISQICKSDGIILRSYSRSLDVIRQMGFEQNAIDNDGFSVLLNGRGYIFYNDGRSTQRQRFTVAHEYGHFINGDVIEKPTYRNKEPFDNDNEIETSANIIASRLLAPACVLWALHINSATDIARLCDISLTSAEWRMKRLNLLYEREKDFLQNQGKSCFLLSLKERAVYNQFMPFIKQVKNQGLPRP